MAASLLKNLAASTAGDSQVRALSDWLSVRFHESTDSVAHQVTAALMSAVPPLAFASDSHDMSQHQGNSIPFLFLRKVALLRADTLLAQEQEGMHVDGPCHLTFPLEPGVLYTGGACST